MSMLIVQLQIILFSRSTKCEKSHFQVMLNSKTFQGDKVINKHMVELASNYVMGAKARAHQ